MKNFERAYKKLREAKLQLADVIEKSFPVGVTIFYSHGSYIRYGSVTMHSNDRVRIMTPSQTQIWIDAYRITSWEKR